MNGKWYAHVKRRGGMDKAQVRTVDYDDDGQVAEECGVAAEDLLAYEGHDETGQRDAETVYKQANDAEEDLDMPEAT